MTIRQSINDRAITEIVHFTTNHGCLGALYGEKVLSRHRLPDDPLVKYLFSPNSLFRKDVRYLDYVNLSIEHINSRFYDKSANSWHRSEDIFWCILAFDPSILEHDGVLFSTTNNMYTGATRGQGVAGLERLYDNRVTLWRGNDLTRPAGLPAAQPTCPQAEVLYQSELSTEHLKSIYVADVRAQSEVKGFLRATFHRDVPVEVDPDKFGDRR